MVAHGLEETKMETGNWYFRLQEISFSKNSAGAKTHINVFTLLLAYFNLYMLEKSKHKTYLTLRRVIGWFSNFSITSTKSVYLQSDIYKHMD